MNRYHLALSLAPLAMSASAAKADGPKEIQYGSPPAWILPAPAVAADTKPSEAAFRIVYQETQERISAAGLESYSAYRIKILKPEALSIGNVAVGWTPSAGTASVHYIRIIRDGTTIDVLKQAKLKILERETGLEQSMLDGNLTATLQVPGLQVGDELEFAATIVRRETAFGTHAAGMAQLPVQGFPGAYRYRLSWPASKPLTVRLTNDLPAATRSDDGRFKSLVLELRDPPAAPNVEGAPPRYNFHRAVEYSDYGSWADLARQMWPIYEAASTLDAKSPLHAEAAKIAAASADPIERAQAALRLVESQVRYVYVGLDGGNYIPARADETWQRRFGDCKAKTVLLLALLRDLGIKAEPALVDSKGGDGINGRLPDAQLFDHVLVRAALEGRDYWLDGTRQGDRYLDMLPQPSFVWALPLSAAGSELVAPSVSTSPYPQLISIVDIDATGGFGKSAVWTARNVLHGEEAFQIATALSTVSAADADRAVKSYWRSQASWVEPEQVSWSYDARHSAMTLTVKGTGDADWEGDAKEGHRLTLPGAGFNPPDKRERPKDQDQLAAWAIEYPRFRCYATTIHLPPPTPGFSWTYSSKPVNRRLAGVIYWRAAGMRGNLVRTVMSSQSYVRELSTTEARQANALIPTFDNYMSSVDETAGKAATQPSALPFDQEPDWSANPAVCSPPPGAAVTAPVAAHHIG